VTFIIILVAMLLFMYLLLIRPQQQQRKRTQEMLNRLQPGDEVITVGGIYGDVIEVHDEKVVLEIAEDVQIEVTRRAIANIVPPESEPGTEEEELEEAEEPLAEEAEAEGEAEEPTQIEERAR
jgi:preprotein translocase subunit YajC